MVTVKIIDSTETVAFSLENFEGRANHRKQELARHKAPKTWILAREAPTPVTLAPDLSLNDGRSFV